MRREKPAPAPFDPLDESLAIRIPGDNKLRPTTLAWSTGEENFECDCMWNWGDGPESIDGSPREMYWLDRVRPVHRIQDRADRLLEDDARRARKEYVSQIKLQLGAQETGPVDWALLAGELGFALSQPAPIDDEDMDKRLRDVLHFIQHAPRSPWQTFVSTIGAMHPDYTALLPWLRLREGRQPLTQRDKGLTLHVIREWAHRVVGSYLTLHVLRSQMEDRQQISRFLGLVKQRRPYLHDELATAFSMGAATLRSMSYPAFRFTLTIATNRRIFDLRPVPKSMTIEDSFSMSSWHFGFDALFAPEVVHYRFFEGEVAVPGHVSFFEACRCPNVNEPDRIPILVCSSFRAPKGLFAGALEDLFRLFEALAWSRGAESVFVVREPYWKHEADVDLRSLRQTPEFAIYTHRADPVMEHANARIGSPVAQSGQIVYRLRNWVQFAMLPENEAERQRIASLPRRAPIPTVLSDEPPLGFISEFPVVF
ncbi:MAG TPA: hypothetical protein PK156_06575 [Polyangium sp.]|nr:hypothetical protein [Polyangium sp.]